jgi:nucleoside-diphosphate-sugar epimerase/predicted dehydrogenase
MTQLLKVGLIGAGYILQSHAKALKAVDGAVLHAVCDLATSRARAAADQHGIPNVFGSLDEIARSDCDVVHILLPPALHIDAASRMVEAGKHTFLEKPMGLGSAACRALTERAAARGVKLGVNHNFLFMQGYQPIRDAIRTHTLGAVDHLAVDWLYQLPLIQFGPFDNWILAAPENLVFELGPHLAAFVIDLVGPVKATAGLAGSPVDIPGGRRVYRHWHLIGEAGRASVVLNLSVTPGQKDRSFKVRTNGGIAHFDFERGVGRIEHTRSTNPIFDNVMTARSAGRALSRDAGRSFLRHALATLRKQPNSDPFGESIAESIRSFYAGIRSGTLDPRHEGGFGSDVMALCESLVAAAGIPQEAGKPRAASAVLPPPQAPTVLVVGGTGFIGRRLVERLVKRGLGVRVLTRNPASAEINLEGLAVEILQGSHGSPATLEKALAGIETVYHLAKAEGKRWQDYIENDINPTRTLAEAALAHGVKRFIYTGTIDSYASGNRDDVITEDTPLDPNIATRNHYARSKAACEALLGEMHREKGLPLVILRPGIVIGMGSPPAHWGVGLFNSETDVTYWGDGRNRLPLVLVEDVADALDRALDAPGIEGRTFLLTDAPLMSARDYVATVEARAGVKLATRTGPVWKLYAVDAAKEAAKHAIRHPNRRPPSFNDWASRTHRARYDSSATQKALGWKPAGSIERLVEGINASVDHFMR